VTRLNKTDAKPWPSSPYAILSHQKARPRDKAVRLDPSYLDLRYRCRERAFLPEIERWVPALENFDPQNALPTSSPLKK